MKPTVSIVMPCFQNGETLASSVDLPTFGKPTRPTSASSLSSKISSWLSPGIPGLAKRGT